MRVRGPLLSTLDYKVAVDSPEKERRERGRDRKRERETERRARLTCQKNWNVNVESFMGEIYRSSYWN